jgi:hypothetical protein
MKRYVVSLSTLALCLALPSLVHAQATRTWVSGVGDDANPCSRTAPCKTFAGAISKTAAGGEISALDPAGYGAVTITKAITLSGDGTLASILATGATGIIVNAGVNDTVIIRNVSISGAANPSSLNGIRFLAGGSLIVENATIEGFPNGMGIDMYSTGNLSVRNLRIMNVAAGLRVLGNGRASLTDASILETNIGITTYTGSTTISRSIVANNAWFGLVAEGGTLNAEEVVLTGNNVAVQSQTGAIFRISNSSLFNNFTSFGCGGGTLASAANNRVGGNAGGSAPCAPNAGIPLQ